MRVEYTPKVLEALKTLSSPLRKAFYKQAEFLTQNLLHPSLHAKKYDEARNIWQARVNRDWRFYFRIEGDRYTIINITPHPK